RPRTSQVRSAVQDVTNKNAETKAKRSVPNRLPALRCRKYEDLYRFKEFVSSKRLAHVSVKPLLQETVAIARHGVRSERQCRCVLVHRHGAEPMKEIDARTLFAEIDVQNEEVETTRTGSLQCFLHVRYEM